MSQVVDHKVASTTETGDLVTAIQRVLRESEEPLTVSKIRSQLPPALRTLNVEEALQRQVAANVLYEYPKYRSQHARYWDRQMPEHIKFLLRQTLADGPLAWSDLRRKLPAYAVERNAETILQEEVKAGRLHRHPRVSSRGGERFGAGKPDPKDYLRTELTAVFGKLQQMGFSASDLRVGAIELLQEQEWGNLPVPPPPAPKAPRPPKAPEAARPTPPAEAGQSTLPFPPGQQP